MNTSCVSLLAAGVFLPFAAVVKAGIPDDGERKMCWAHVVRWGFFHSTYDEAGKVQDQVNPSTDRTLLGRLTHERQAFVGNAKAQIDCARQYGIDGFCINMVDPKSYIGVGDFLRAAEGTDFKVALCMDNYVSRPVDYCITHLGNFLKKYYNHPNQARVKGKPVIFLYNTGMPLDKWKLVVDALKAQKLEACYVHRASFEWEAAVRPENLKASLAVNDGLYDFGSCGFSPTLIQKRVQALADGLKKERPDGLLVAGVVNGYLGRAVGNYRPFLNSRSFIHNWEAVLKTPRVNWVCVTTWNDYAESTHIEPSVVNRDALARLNQEYIRQWKNLPYPARPAHPVISYHEEVLAGHDLTLEVLNFPYNCGDSSVEITLTNAANGRAVKTQTFKLPKDKIGVQTMRLPHAEMRNVMCFRVFAKVVNHDDRATGTFDTGKNVLELYPVVRRSEYVESQRTIRLPLNTVNPNKWSLTLENNKLIARCKTWGSGGRVELLRNGYPVEVREFQHEKSPICRMDFKLAEYGRSPYDVYIIRFTDVSGNVAFSNPAVKTSGKTGAVQQPVLVTGSDFDEDWPLWPVRPAARLEKMSIPQNMIFKLCYDLEEGQGKVARSSTDWKIPLSIGMPGRGFRVTPQMRIAPEWVKVTGPQGNVRSCLKFFGDSVATLPVRTMPVGVFTFEALISAEASDKPMVLFGEQKSFAVSVLPDGKIAVDYIHEQNPRLNSTVPVKGGVWTHLAVVCTGDKLQIFLNGKAAGEVAIKPQTSPINSLPALGNHSRTAAAGFRGLVAGYAVAGTPLSPGKFQLALPAGAKK